MGERLRFKLSRLREIGWARWDPIGLSGSEGTRDDEYDNYLLRAAAQLENGADIEEVVRFLASIEVEHMGLDDNASALPRARTTAAAIRDYVAELRGQRP
jgi:hypothetical protein